MITAVDTNILIDVFRDDPDFAEASQGYLKRCLQEGVVVACDVVWAETAALFPDRKTFQRVMSELPVAYSALQRDAAEYAGRMWRAYRARGGRRRRVMADFVIAAHAAMQCDRLLSRDRGFYGRSFRDLQVLDPTR